MGNGLTANSTSESARRARRTQGGEQLRLRPRGRETEQSGDRRRGAPQAPHWIHPQHAKAPGVTEPDASRAWGRHVGFQVLV